jgi:hypothetical protein
MLHVFSSIYLKKPHNHRSGHNKIPALLKSTIDEAELTVSEEAVLWSACIEILSESKILSPHLNPGQALCFG